MFENRNVFCLILARGGSKGLPKKNILPLCGKPLIAHSIETAKKVKYIDKIYVSTDNKEIRKISKNFGADVVLRPKHLATDTALYLDAIKHLLDIIIESENENPIIVILPPTTPNRAFFDVKKCIELFNNEIDCVASMNKIKFHPSHVLVEKSNKLVDFYFGLHPISNRQESEPLYSFNGSILVTDSNFLKKQTHYILGGKIRGYLLDEEHSIDIDTKLDYELCKLVMERSNV